MDQSLYHRIVRPLALFGHALADAEEAFVNQIAAIDSRVLRIFALLVYGTPMLAILCVLMMATMILIGTVTFVGNFVGAHLFALLRHPDAVAGDATDPAN